MTFEIAIGLGSTRRGVGRAAGLRLPDEPRAPELTALANRHPGARSLWHVQIGKSTDSEGHEISVIGGQIDITLRPISLRIAASSRSRPFLKKPVV
jgi:hypothetical protein